MANRPTLQPASTHPVTIRRHDGFGSSLPRGGGQAKGRVTTGELRAGWRREAIESGHDPDEWVKVVLGQLAAAPRTGEAISTGISKTRPESRSKWPGPRLQALLAELSVGFSGGRRRPLPHGPVVARPAAAVPQTSTRIP